MVGQLVVAGSAVNGFVAQDVTTANGRFVLNSDGSYAYTLTNPASTSPQSNGANTVLGVNQFTYVVLDADGNSTSGTVTIDVIDDAPIARLDTDAVTEGALTDGNVLSGVGTSSGTAGADTAGADGYTGSGGVVGVRAGSDVGTPAIGGTGAPIIGLYGTLTLGTGGGYTYVANDNGVTANQTDVFVYTVRDGDGDLSTTTLSINVNNVTVLATDSDVLVNEAGLPNGTAAATSSEIDADGVIAPSGGTGPYTFTLNGSADGAYGTLVLNATTGAYVYTLDTAYTTSPAANNGTNLEDNRDSFGYTVTDANGNSTTGVIDVDIIDDVPVIFYPDSAASLNGNSAPTTATLNLGNSIGADGLGSIVFDITDGQLATDINGLNLMLGGQQLYLHGDGTSVLTATTSAAATGGTLGYTVTIDAATGNYVFDVNGTISNGTETNFSNLTSSAAGNVQFRGIEVGPDATPIDVLLSASSNGAQATVNTDAELRSASTISRSG